HGLDSPCERLRGGDAQADGQDTGKSPLGSAGLLRLPDQHRPTGGNEQQDQDDEAAGVRVPRPGVLQAQDPGDPRGQVRFSRMSPIYPGRCATMTHDYKRNGTTTLFAALDMLEGRLIGQCMPRHRHQEFIKFLKQIDAETPPDLDLHLIVDNYATHKHPKVEAWLKRHKRFHLHFIPTSSSWLN